jgi:MFS family permease
MTGDTVAATGVGRQKANKAAWAILAAMGFGALIAQMFSTVIGPALPTIKEDLALGLSAQTWTITAYSLAFGAALVAGGRMGDLVGEVRMIVIGFLIFGAGLLMSAIAVGGPLLISGRAIQGIGIGISAPATLSIVVNSFPLAQRGLAVGVWGFAHGFGLLLGPLFAAWMMEIASWRWVFWVALPLTALVIFVTLAATRGYKSVLAKGSYDWLGLILGATGITLVTYGLQNSSASWTATATWGALVAGLGLLAAFAVVETRIAHPLVDFTLWKERLFSGGFFAESAVGFVYIPFLIFIGSLYFINVLGYSPGKAANVILITTGICMVFEPPAGKWVDKVGPGTGLDGPALRPQHHAGADGDSVGAHGNRCGHRATGLQHRRDVRGRRRTRRDGLGSDADDVQHPRRARGRSGDLDHRHPNRLEDRPGYQCRTARCRVAIRRCGSGRRYGTG